MKKLIPIIFTILFFSSCQKDQYYLFNDVKRLQFGPDISRIYQSSFNLADTLKMQTFFYESDEITTDTVYFDIYTIGGTTTQDRFFVLKQQEVVGVDNAIPGVHYVPFDDSKMRDAYSIKAGTVHKKVPIVLLRDPSMKDKTFTLKFEIVENENFRFGEKSNLWRKLQTTDRLSQPNSWTTYNSTYYLGAYSRTKHQFMIDVTGEKWDQDFILGLDLSTLDYYKSTLKIALIELNKTLPEPLEDENEVEVKFP